MDRAAEDRRRDTLRRAVAAIAAAALVPMIVYDGAIAAVLARCEAFVRECLQAIVQLSPMQWIPAALLLAGLVYAGVDLARQIRRVRRVLRLHALRNPVAGEPIHALATAHGALGRVRVIEGAAPNPAFATGLLRPRVYIAADLQHELSPDQLRALFRHELWHVLRRDPLRFMVLRGLGRFLFWLPVIRILAEDLVEEAELQADDFAAEAADPLEVAGALVAVARRTGPALALAAGAAGARPLQRRVRRLLDEDAGPPPPALTFRRSATSLAFLGLLWAGIAFGGPTAASAATAGDAPESAAHCPSCTDEGGTMDHAGCHFLHLLMPGL